MAVLPANHFAIVQRVAANVALTMMESRLNPGQCFASAASDPRRARLERGERGESRLPRQAAGESAHTTYNSPSSCPLKATTTRRSNLEEHIARLSAKGRLREETVGRLPIGPINPPLAEIE